MTDHAEIIEQLVAEFNAESAKVYTLAESIVDSELLKDTVRAIFKDDSDVRYELGIENNKLVRLVNLFNRRLLATYWRKFFSAIKLMSQIGESEYYKISGQFEEKYGKFPDQRAYNYTVDVLTEIVAKYFTVNDDRYDHIPTTFLRRNMGTWKNRKTEYKTRVTIIEFVGASGFSNDRVQHDVCEFVAMLANRVTHENVSLLDIKEKIGFRYGMKDIECNLIKGVDFKLKPNGNAELKLSKEVVEYLNSKL